jgi:hypothetical protein
MASRGSAGMTTADPGAVDSLPYTTDPGTVETPAVKSKIENRESRMVSLHHSIALLPLPL